MAFSVLRTLVVTDGSGSSSNKVEPLDLANVTRWLDPSNFSSSSPTWLRVGSAYRGEVVGESSRGVLEGGGLVSRLALVLREMALWRLLFGERAFLSSD